MKRPRENLVAFLFACLVELPGFGGGKAPTAKPRQLVLEVVHCSDVQSVKN